MSLQYLKPEMSSLQTDEENLRRHSDLADEEAIKEIQEVLMARKVHRVKLGSLFRFHLSEKDIPKEVNSRLGRQIVQELVRKVNSELKKARFNPFISLYNRFHHKQQRYFKVIYCDVVPVLEHYNEVFVHRGVSMEISSRYATIFNNHPNFYINFSVFDL